VALANRAYADAHGGVLVLRIDDTDRQRSTADAVEGVFSVLEWLGIAYEEGPRFQRTRDDLYTEFLERLLSDGVAYHCFCTGDRLSALREAQISAGLPPRYDGTCRSLGTQEVARRHNLGERSVVRLRVPEDEAYDTHDMVRGSVAAPSGSFGDFILRRSDGTVGYLFASVCDDLDMQITHVIRGEDHLPNTARQLALLDAFDARPPRFAHLPLLQSPGGGKLAKRDHLGSVDELRRAGYLPVTVRRYLAELLGQGARDLLAAGAAGFDVSKVPHSSPTVDEDRLASLGREDMAALDGPALSGLLAQAGFELRTGEVPLSQEIAEGTPTVASLRHEVARLRERPAPPDEPFDETDLKVLREFLAREATAAAAAATSPAAAPISAEEAGAMHAAVLTGLREWGAARNLPPRAVLQPVRRALTGQRSGPGLQHVLGALGPDEVQQRVQRALGGLTSQVSG